MNITVPILDREYSISCPPASKDDLYKSVAELQAICDKIQKKNPKAGIDRILVAAAVNLAARASAYRTEMDKVTRQMEILAEKVDLIE